MIYRTLNILLSLCLILFIQLNHTLYAQNFDFKYYNVDDGLPQSQVNSIIQDSRGYLWMATAGGGICQFDGVNFTQYTEKNGLSGDIISSITEDLEGNIWATSSLNGISKYNGRKFINYTTQDGLISNDANTFLYTDNTNRIWIGSNYGLCVYENGSFKKFQHISFLNNPIHQIYQDSKNDIWVSTENGLIYLTERDTIQLTTTYGLPSNNIKCIREDEDGNYLIGTLNKGAIKLLSGSIDPQLNLEFEAIDIPKHVTINDILIDRDKDIWFATQENGIFLQHPDKSIINITKSNGLKNNHIITIYQDRTGNIWFGSAGSGLVKLGTKAFTYFDNIEGLNSPSIFSITEDNHKNIWITTIDDGIYKYDFKSVTHYNINNSIPGNIIRSSTRDHEGNLWFASNNGLLKYSNGKFTTYTTANGLPSNSVRTVFIDSKNQLWIGMNGNGLVKYHNNKFTTYNQENKNLPHNHVHSLFEDSKGNLWIGTGNGAVKYSNGVFYDYSSSKGFCNLYIGSITEDKNGNIWFGTDRCVVRYDGVDFKPLTINDGISSNVIYLLHSDRHGNVWVGTNKGIDKIILNSYGQINKIKHYSAPEGFRGIECNSRAIYEDTKGNLWIGTVNGLIKYSPKEDKSNVYEPVIHLNNVKLFFNEINWSNYSKNFKPWNNVPDDVVFDYNENHLTFEFSGINLSHPEYIQYSFKLDPLDNEWFADTKKNSATYSNLPPGDYVFNVKARNNEGIWTQEAAVFKFRITAPFWKTWWFYVVCALVLIYILFKISSYKEKQQIKISRELEKKVRERTLLIEKQRDEKEVLLKEIHHRVKNNLQVINSLLSIQSSYTSDPKSLALFDEAKNRIRSMALIHEKMYQTGDLAHIDFQDYIMALTNDLISTYSINCDIFLDIKIDEVKFDIDTIIPLGLLLNEIISNTLKYAFVGRKKGQITIHLHQNEDNSFELIAGDNGIGMEITLEEESNSLGLELIKIFTEQLDGEIEILDKEGTLYKINFKPRKP
ncbi:MAG: hypothetical protein H6586_01190 [Flavobacteriales bacterium]|nr:hypothetical protein [Flavobacteriales bacterium]